MVALVALVAVCSVGFLAAAPDSCRTQATAARDQVVTDAATREAGFRRWLDDVRREAGERGIGASTIDEAFTDLQLLDVVLERDATQAEFTLTLDQYLGRRVTTRVVRDARQQAATYRALLSRIASTYGVPPHVLVAVWGLESNFGRFSGVRPTIAALATLAYDGRRASYFRGELLAALQILDRGDVPLDRLKGSWAGALGQPQFMPSVYLAYAEDFDGDGHRDIWTSLPDVFASIARYLRDHGWVSGQRWGREVRLPRAVGPLREQAPLRTTGCSALREMSDPLPLARWDALGVRTIRGGRLPTASFDASLVRAGSRSFLVYPNYEALIAYNCAHAYALSVGLLSDRLPAGGGD